MFRWAMAFLVVALGAAVFGFSGIATGAATMAKAVFALALMVAVVGAIVAVARRDPPDPPL